MSTFQSKSKENKRLWPTRRKKFGASGVTPRFARFAFGVRTGSGTVRCERFANHSIRGAFAQPHSERSAMSIRRPETAPPALPTTTTRQPRSRKPSPKVRAAIEALVTGQVRTITAAAKKVGLSRERLSRAFSEPHNAEALRTRAAREVALSSGRAAARLNQLIDSASQRVALEATKFSLGVAGIAFCLADFAPPRGDRISWLMSAFGTKRASAGTDPSSVLF